MRRSLALKTTICFLVFLSSGWALRANELDREIEQLENFSNVYHLIRQRYVKAIPIKRLMRAAIQGMVESLDPYSSVLSQKELENLELQSVGKYAGIGVTVQFQDDLFVVTQVFEDSPAAKAGMFPGDVLVEIDGSAVGEKSQAELSQMIIGEMGGKLKIGFYHPENRRDIIRKEIVRALVKSDSVDCFPKGESIVVVRIHQFIKQTPSEVRKCLKNESHPVVIIDLRNNPGGLLVSSVETAEIFVGMGPIVEIRDRNDAVIEKYISRGFSTIKPDQLLVFINQYSASAAEILAGAIKDRKAGKLIGENSFGKGVVQSVFPLENGVYVKLTTASYFTPSGRSFHNVGIKPDVLVRDRMNVKRYSDGDLVYQRAVTWARNHRKN